MFHQFDTPTARATRARPLSTLADENVDGCPFGIDLASKVPPRLGLNGYDRDQIHEY